MENHPFFMGKSMDQRGPIKIPWFSPGPELHPLCTGLDAGKACGC